MKNIKIYDYIKSEIAINVNDANDISKTIIQKYKDSQWKVSIDFSNIKSLISPFMRALLKPLVVNEVKFEWIKFDSSRGEDIYKRILEELNTVWTENIRELQN